jgi:hypothetical protein
MAPTLHPVAGMERRRDDKAVQTGYYKADRKKRSEGAC